MKTTIGDVCSRIRTRLRGKRQDPLLTDRTIYSVVNKHAKWLMKREDSKNRLMAFSGVLQTLDYVELVEVDKVEACCSGLSSDIMIKRTKDKMPVFMQGYWGPLIRTVASLDGSEELQPTVPSSYLVMSKSKNFKYNKTKYYWYIDDYIYFPNLEWDAVRIEGIFEDDIASWTCDTDSCIERADQTFNIPDYLLGELEERVFQEFVGMMQLPPDFTNDKQNQLR